MRRVNHCDKKVVVDILVKSFKDDPHINFLLEKSKNKNKIPIIMGYLFEETMCKGEIYLNEDNSATALWLTQTDEKITWEFIYRNLSFLMKIGFVATYRILKMEGLLHKIYPTNHEFIHLYLIGVLPEFQGRGYAKRMIHFMIEKAKQTKAKLYLETANQTNVSIYNKLGFNVFLEVKLYEHTLFCMKRFA